MSRWRIDRERVVSFLGGTRQNRVVLLVAQAGYGKSIALRQYLQRETQPYAFFRVEPETATLIGFLRGLTESLERFVPGAHLSLTMAHERAMQSRTPFVELANWLGEHLRDVNLRIVIDDLHNATSEAIPDFLSRATTSTPESIKWIIAARPKATFSPAPWLARGEIDWPIDETILQFTSDELRDLARLCKREPSADQLDKILELTEGWPSAAALGLICYDELDRAVDRASSSELYEALAQALFERYDGTVQELLLQTSVYDSLDVDVLEADERLSLFLRIFEQDGIYIDELNEGSYRYDGVFRSYLLRILGERGAEFEKQAYERAGPACEKAGRWSQALVLY
ncbi:MAG: AAA family ATPase, partial [Polyangiaceae bacterium]